MQDQPRISNKPTKYAKIPLIKRIKLLELVQQNSYSVARACKKLNIRTSTGKLIVKKYRQEGVFFEKKSDRQARLAKSNEAQVAQIATNQQLDLQRQNRLQTANDLHLAPTANVCEGDFAVIEMQDIHRMQINPFSLINVYLVPYHNFPFYY